MCLFFGAGISNIFIEKLKRSMWDCGVEVVLLARKHVGCMLFGRF